MNVAQIENYKAGSRPLPVLSKKMRVLFKLTSLPVLNKSSYLKKKSVRDWVYRLVPGLAKDFPAVPGI